MTQYHKYHKRIFNNSSLLFLILFFSANLTIWGQVNGDYRSRSDGDWNNRWTWEKYNNGWGNSSDYPTTTGTVTILNGHTVRWAHNGTLSIPLLILAGSGELEVQEGRTLNIDSGSVVRIAGSETIKLKRNSAVNFNSGSICELTRNGTTKIPKDATWDTNSTLKVLNSGGSLDYRDLNQSFGNVDYNRTGQTANQLGFITAEIRGNFTINSTGSSSLVINYSNRNFHYLTIGGDFTLNGGSFQLCQSSNNADVYLELSGNMYLNAGTLAAVYSDYSGFFFVRSAGEQSFVSSIVLNDQTNKRFFYKNSGGPTRINQIYQGTSAQKTIYGYVTLGTDNPIQSSATLLKKTTINNPAGVVLTTNQTLNENLYLLNGSFNTTNQTLTMANASTIERTGGTLTKTPTFPGVVDVVYSAHTAALTTGLELPDVATQLRNLLITNLNGIKANKSFTVNGELNLNASNPNDTDGLLDLVIDYGNYAANPYGTGDFMNNTAAFNNLNSYVLTMSETATTIGSGDVTGKIRRSKTGGLDLGPYTFGNKNTSLQFTAVDGSAIPTTITVAATRGSHGTHIDNGGTVTIYGTTANRNTVKRMYQVMKTLPAGTNANASRMTLRMAYEDSELNGNPEEELITWDHHLPYGGVTPHEHGKTNSNTTEKWVELAGHSVAYLATENDTTFTKYWMLSKKESLSDYEWLGAVNSNWNILSNWSGSKIPNFEANVLIPTATKTNNDPTINASSGYSSSTSTGTTLAGTGVKMRTLEINSDGILNVSGTPDPIVMYGGPNAAGDGINYTTWNNSGLFNAGSSTVLFDYDTTASESTIAGTTIFNNLSVASGKKLELQGNSTTQIVGTLTNDGIFDASSTANTVEFLGDNQTIIVPNGGTNNAYHHLTLSGTGTTVVPSTLMLLGDLTVNQNSGLSFAGKTVNFNGTTPQNIQTSNANLTTLTIPTMIISNVLAELTSSFSKLAVADLTLNGGLFVNATDTVVLTNTITKENGVLGGTGTYEFTGPTTIVSGLFDNNRARGGVNLNKSGATFVIPADFAINGNLTLTEGNLPLGTNSLELGGNITRTNGVIDATLGTLVFSGNTALTDQIIETGVLNAQTVANISVVTNGKPLLSETTQLTGLLNLDAGTFQSNGHLVLQSTASKTAMVGPVGITAMITGDVTVEHYVPGRRGYRFFSAPVTTSTSIYENWQENGSNAAAWGTHITGAGGAANGFDVTGTNNPSLYTFSNTAGSWDVVTNTNATTIQAGIPHYLMVRGDRTISLSSNNPTATNTVIRTKGALFTGAKTSSDLSLLENGFNLIGNPYQAPVNMTSVLNVSTNVNPNFYYVWDPSINTRGGYVAVDLISNTNNIASSAANRYLQPGQGFFFQTLNAGLASINFQENSKNLTEFNNINSKIASTRSENIRLTLYENKALAANAAATDGLVLKFSSSYSNSVNQSDAPKMINQDEDFAIQKSNGNLSIESRDWPANNDAIPLYINKYRSSNYTIKAEMPSLNNLKAYLLDNYTGKLTELVENTTVNYSFTVSAEASKTVGRFELLFKEKLLSTNNPLLSVSSGVYPNPNQGNFYYNLPQGYGTAEVKVFTSLGQEIQGFRTQINNSALEVNIENQVSTGIYYARYFIDGETIVKKIIIQK